MKAYQRLTFLISVAALLVAGVGVAQEQRGSIEGVLTDPSGGVLPGVTVEATSPSLGKPAATTSDAAGVYRFPALPPGRYQVTAKLQGFAPAQVRNIDLRLGQVLKVDLSLQIGAIEQEIIVTDEAPLIDVKQSATASSIRDELIEKLPRGRDFTTVVTQAASANNESKLAGISIDGASGAENRYIIDGIDTTNLQTGRSAKNLITDFIDEVQVKRSGYAAEYGGATGGVINVITKSGGPKWTGDVGMYFSADNLQGDTRKTLRLNPQNDTIAEYIAYPDDDWTRLEPGFGVGGPVLTDRAWMFASYLPELETTNRTVTFLSDGIARSYIRKKRTHYATGNLTSQLTSKLRAKGSMNLSPEHRYGDLPSVSGTSNPATDFGILELVQPNYSVSGNLDYTATNHLYLGLRAGFFHYNSYESGVPNEVWRQFVGSNTMFPEIPPALRGASGFRNILSNSAVTRDIQERMSLSVDATYFASFAGEHAFKGGVQFDRIRNDVFRGYQQPRVLLYWNRTYTTSGTVPGFPGGTRVQGPYGYYRVLQIVTTGDVSSNNVGLFLQDSWTVNNRLTINAGVRTESEKIPSFDTTQGQAKNAIDFAFGDKIAPRVGFSLDVKGDGKWKAYGSWGIFYDITKLEMPRGLFGGDKWIDYFYSLDTYDWPTLGGGPCPPSCPGTLYDRIDQRPPSNLAGDSRIDPNLKPMKSQEITLGLVHELSKNMSIGIRYVHKQLDRTIEDVGIFDPNIGQVYFIANPGFGIAEYTLGRDLPPQPKAKRDYDGVELDFTKKLAKNWSLHASYLWSRLEGNYSGLASSDENGRSSPNVNRFFDDLRMSFDQNGKPVFGPLATDRTHQFKLQGLYDFDFGSSIGANFYASTGTPVSREISVPPHLPILYMGRESDGRTPTYSQVDVYFQHEFRFADNSALQLSLNVLNLLDQDTATSIYNIETRDDNPVGTPEEFFAGFDAQAQINDPKNKIRKDPQFLMAGDPGTVGGGFQSRRSLRLGLKYMF